MKQDILLALALAMVALLVGWVLKSGVLLNEEQKRYIAEQQEIQRLIKEETDKLLRERLGSK